MEAFIAWPLIALGLMSGLFFFMRSKQIKDELIKVTLERDEALRRNADFQMRWDAAQKESQVLQIHAARIETELQQQDKSHRERLALMESAENRLKETFQAISGEALRKSGESFLQMAEGVLGKQTERAQGDLELRRQAVDNLVAPLQQTLQNVEQRIGEIEKQRVGAYQGLQEQITLLLGAQKNLQLEAAHLASALKSPTTRGRWGELQLRRVVELSGMLAYCDFYEQHHATNAEGKSLRPDMVVRLPGNRSIAIDSKAPLQAYMEAIDTDDDDKRKKLFEQHAQLIRRQVQALGQKGYWEQLEGSPEFVLLFLPGEAFFSAALQADPSLIEYGADNRVLIATPTTLIALLRTTAFAWRQEDISKHAEEVSRLGRELYSRIADLSDHMVSMGKGLTNSVQAYNKLVGSLESRVLVSARRFQELKADDPKKSLKEINVIDEQARALGAAELMG
jgi:DNA recombination protein RmuC